MSILLANIFSGILICWIGEKGHVECGREEELMRMLGTTKALTMRWQRELQRQVEGHLFEAHGQKILMLAHQDGSVGGYSVGPLP